MTGTDLVYSEASLEQRKGYAQAIARAGDLLPQSLYENVNIDGKMIHRPSAGKVLLIAETGNMLGIHPIAALNGVNVIEGKPTVAPALMRALIRRAGHTIRVRKIGTIEGGDYAVTVTLIRSDDPAHPFESTWTPHRAARANLCTYAFDDEAKVWRVRARSSKGNPLPWELYPESMCLARASREVANEGADDVIMGVYTPEELGANVNEAGELLDITATAVDRTPPRQPAPEPEPVDAELVDESTGEVHDEQPARGPYDQAEADEWAAQIAATPELGHPTLPHAIESDTLAGLFLRAQRAGVLTHLADDPDRVPEPKTIEQLIADRRDELQAADRARKAGS